MDRRIYTVDGVQNIRDLGGYSVTGGGTVRHGRFIRAASLGGLTEAGKRALLELGVDMVVDLRSTYEASLNPDEAVGSAVQHYHIPMLDHINSQFAQNNFKDFPPTMAEAYIGLLKESGPQFARVFEAFARSLGAVLFHCTAGKDRTGITAMLLLELAGVDNESIVEDYCLTAKLLKLDMIPGLPQHIFEAKAESMEAALTFLGSTYGGAAAYLESIGVSKRMVETIKSKLLD